ncbi:MAG: TolC family protein [Leptolyngbya sp. SIO4C1]|nr:TolC family protein [Leptolyngbya sp. SIO4C1]
MTADQANSDPALLAATPVPEAARAVPRFASSGTSEKTVLKPVGERSLSASRLLAQTHSGDRPDLPSLPPVDEDEEPVTTESETPAEENLELDPALQLPPESTEPGSLDEAIDALSEPIEPVVDDITLPPEDLLADPNPLTVPTFTEEVEIEDTRTVTLEEAIELTYANSQDLQAALLELRRSEAALDEAQAQRLPSVTAGSSLTFQESQSSSFDFQTGSVVSGDSELDTTLGGTVEINYDLFTSGQRAATIRAAEAQVRTSELEVERRQEVLRLATANLYYALQESTENIRINQAFLEEAGQNLRDNRIRQREGVGTRFDVLRAEVQFANARQALIQSQSQRRVAQRDLARQLNLPSTLDIDAAPVKKAGTWPLTLEESIVLAFQNRADLEQQLAQREIGLQQSIAAIAAVRPQVSLFANYTVQDTFDDGSDASDTYSFGARLNWLLFDGGAARARSRQQELSALLAEERFSETLDQVRFDVEEAYFNLQANEENIDTARVAVNQAQEALRLANLRLDAGVGTQLDVLTAQSELTQAEGNLVQALLGYNRALAALQRAISNLEATL